MKPGRRIWAALYLLSLLTGRLNSPEGEAPDRIRVDLYGSIQVPAVRSAN